MSPNAYVQALWTKSFRFNQNYSGYTVKGIFVEGLPDFTGNSVQPYCNANSTDTLHDFAWYKNSLRTIQRETYNQDKTRQETRPTRSISHSCYSSDRQNNHVASYTGPGALMCRPYRIMDLTPLPGAHRPPHQVPHHCRRCAVLLHLPRPESMDIRIPDLKTGHSRQFNQYPLLKLW